MKTAITVYNNLKDKVLKIYTLLNLSKHETPKGRKEIIENIDAITLSLFKQKQGIETKKSLWELIEPPCTYKTLVVSINRVTKYIGMFLGLILSINQKESHVVKHTDATDIPVCLVKNAKNHKTMSGLSSKSKTGKGWFYGLKLHLTSDLNRKVLCLRFTSANSDDRKVCKEMNEKLRGIFVADAGYVSKELDEDFFIENERMILSTPRGNMKKLATSLQTFLQGTRMLIELNFRNLKMFFNLVTSLPRSIDGYLGNYLSAITAYLLA
jgi:hypothetical protein